MNVRLPALLLGAVLLAACTNSSAYEDPQAGRIGPGIESEDATPKTQVDAAPEESGYSKALTVVPTMAGEPQWCGPTISYFVTLSEAEAALPGLSEKDAEAEVKRFAEAADEVLTIPGLNEEVAVTMTTASRMFSTPEALARPDTDPIFSGLEEEAEKAGMAMGIYCPETFRTWGG